jgi:hypothetical protein
MLEINPYAPPAIPAEETADFIAEVVPMEGAWRDGSAIVTTHDCQLPPRCVITNEPAVAYQEFRLEWYPSWVLWTLLLGPLFFYFMATAAQKIRIKVPLGASCLARRKLRKSIGRGLAIVCAIVSVAFSLPAGENAPVILTCGLSLGVLCLIIGEVELVQLTVKTTNKDYVWLIGAGEPFLASLPSWRPVGRAEI